VVEGLRQPTEDGRVVVTRVPGTVLRAPSAKTRRHAPSVVGHGMHALTPKTRARFGRRRAAGVVREGAVGPRGEQRAGVRPIVRPLDRSLPRGDRCLQRRRHEHGGGVHAHGERAVRGRPPLLDDEPEFDQLFVTHRRHEPTSTARMRLPIALSGREEIWSRYAIAPI